MNATMSFLMACGPSIGCHIPVPPSVPASLPPALPSPPLDPPTHMAIGKAPGKFFWPLVKGLEN